MSKGRFTFEIAMSTMFARLTGRIALLLFGFAVSGFSASFDCVKAQSQTEKLICQSAALSRVDEEMAAAYKNALAVATRLAPADAKQIRVDQIAWLKGPIQRCTNQECLAKAYKERTDALVFYASKVTASPTTNQVVGHGTRQAATAHDLLESCLSGGQTPELVCLSEELDRQDARLNKEYNRVMARYKQLGQAENIVTLRKVELEWIGHVKSDCDTTPTDFMGNPDHRRIECRLDSTAARADELAKMP